MTNQSARLSPAKKSNVAPPKVYSEVFSKHIHGEKRTFKVVASNDDIVLYDVLTEEGEDFINCARSRIGFDRDYR